ncbi:MAG: tetratricopeptide repeat protein [Chitinophagaceae bacterium]|nr:tetratricopeptide repeat protein [Chitinophagaceae bacterium]
MERIEKLIAFLAQNPADAFVQHALALEYIKIGNAKQAEEIFKSIIQNEPQNTGTYYHLAKLLTATGNKTEALEVYEKGIEICKQVGDQHALRELLNAYEDLIY